MLHPPQQNLDSKQTKYELVDNAFLTTPNGREMLKYLIDCALPEGTIVRGEIDNQTYVFEGGAGMAPEWLNRSMTEAEQRWVSACMLARVNHFGEKVRISMRGSSSSSNEHLPDILRPTAEELQHYRLFEGGFYGNLFLEEAKAYTCQGSNSEDQYQELTKAKRVCTHPSGEFLSTGEPLSQCGFIITGVCDELADNKRYDETIFIFLKSS